MQKFFVTIDENTCNQEVYEKGVLVEVCDMPKKQGSCTTGTTSAVVLSSRG